MIEIFDRDSGCIVDHSNYSNFSDYSDFSGYRNYSGYLKKIKR